MRLAFLAAFFLAGCTTIAEPPAGLPIAAEAVPLNAEDPAQDRIGRLRFMGGLHLATTDTFGSLSALRWHDGRLWSVIDEGGWASFAPVERDGRLVGATGLELGKLHGPDGAPLEERPVRDAEGLTRDGDGWLVSFERNHRIWRYANLSGPAAPVAIDPAAVLGPMPPNEGVEALAGDSRRLFLCAERIAAEGPNCAIVEDGAVRRVSLTAPPALEAQLAFPVDADFGGDGTLYVLFRSYSPEGGSRGAILARTPDGHVRHLASLVAPYTVDNFEGLAVREERGRTFLYLISDENFDRRDNPAKTGWQRQLLMKFEVVD